MIRKLESNIGLPFLAGVTIDALEKHWIINALRYYGNNKTQTAGALGISIRTLDNKLEKYEDEQIRDRDRAAEDRANKAAILERMRGPLITQYNGLGSANQINGLPRNSEAAEASIQNGDAPDRRVRMEPAFDSAQEQTLPVPQRQEVQTVLPKHSGSGGHGKRRS